MAEIKGWKVSGIAEWLLWPIIHVFLLIVFRNRLTVTREWLWASFKREGSTPLITEYAGVVAPSSASAGIPFRKREVELQARAA